MADPMWLMVMFDLPTKLKNEQRAANQYRNLLMDLGFERIQLSVYAKYFINSTGTTKTLTAVKLGIPDNGIVRVLRIPDATWAASITFEQGVKQVSKGPPEQLLLFG